MTAATASIEQQSLVEITTARLRDENGDPVVPAPRREVDVTTTPAPEQAPARAPA